MNSSSKHMPIIEEEKKESLLIKVEQSNGE